MRRDLSSVDSIDGLCTSVPSSTDDDTSSLYSEFESGTKPQKLETRIGINHFNRYAWLFSHFLLLDGFFQHNTRHTHKKNMYFTFLLNMLHFNSLDSHDIH